MFHVMRVEKCTIAAFELHLLQELWCHQDSLTTEENLLHESLPVCNRVS